MDSRGPKCTKYETLGGHVGFGLPVKNAGIFGRDMEANYLTKGFLKSNQSSNLNSRRMVTKIRF